MRVVCLFPFLVSFQQFFPFESLITLIAIEISHVGNIKVLITFEMFFLGMVVQIFKNRKCFITFVTRENKCFFMDDFYMKIKVFSCCEYRSVLLVVVFFLNFCMFIFIGAAPSDRGERESQEEEGAGKKEGYT